MTKTTFADDDPEEPKDSDEPKPVVLNLVLNGQVIGKALLPSLQTAMLNAQRGLSTPVFGEGGRKEDVPAGTVVGEQGPEVVTPNTVRPSAAAVAALRASTEEFTAKLDKAELKLLRGEVKILKAMVKLWKSGVDYRAFQRVTGVDRLRLPEDDA